MNYPIIFPIAEPIEKVDLDTVRKLASRNGFTLRNNAPGRSELWLRPTPDGYAVVRIDTFGNGTQGKTPHCHKEWVPREHLELYLKPPPLNQAEKHKLAQVVVFYPDRGIRLDSTHNPFSEDAEENSETKRKRHIAAPQ